VKDGKTERLGGKLVEPAPAAGVIGQQLSHYRILERIGSGGMSEVFKAEDIRLGRVVAIKLISAGLVGDLAAKERFFQEARTISALDHQHICTLHDLGETPDGRLFLVMAYYPGQTLSARIRRGALPVVEALEIAHKVALGLARAHEIGVVHRDMKPGNVMLTERGEVKILDFGIAKLAGQAGRDLTQTGTVMGTAAYMSPEQASGRPVDHRTDVWSLGVVLYEMLVGSRPFQGESPLAVIHAILHHDPVAGLTLPDGAPEGLSALLERAMAKDPAMRYAGIQDMADDLARLLVSEGEQILAPPPTMAYPDVNRSIVVLPFADLSPGRDGDYFADGLTDEVITDLSAIRALRVISRTSANRLKGSDYDLQEIAARLKVHFVLEGGVRRIGDTLRVTAKLIDARTDSLVWAEKYSGSLEDVFAIQESLSRRIVEALRIKLSVAEERRLADRRISDIEAYDYYLKARQEIYRYSKEALERAIAYLERGVEIDPQNPLLLTALGYANWQCVNAGISSDPSYLEVARQRAEQALAIEPDFPQAYRLLGLVRLLQGRTLEGVRLLQRSLAGDPTDTDTLALLASCYGFLGQPEAGGPLVRRLLELDPLTPMYQSWPGILAMMQGKFDEAVPPLLTSYRLEPQNPMVRCLYGQALALAGERAEARRLFAALADESPESFFGGLARLYERALSCDRAGVEAAADEKLRAAAAADPLYAWSVAEAFALVDDRAEAVAWLERGVERGLLNYPLLAEHDPLLAGLRADPAFAALMQKVEARWRAFEL
jgi:non-specific serine/threonine protein kinase